jgi:hypothetical protein
MTAENNEGWTTTEVAAKALKVTPRTVRNYVEQGVLEGRKVKRGRARPLEIEIGSLKRLRAQMSITGNTEIPEGGYEEAERAEGVQGALLEIVADLKRVSAEAADARARLELTEQTESTLREEIEKERFARRAAQQRLATVEPEMLRLERELELERAKPWYRRLFG